MKFNKWTVALATAGVVSLSSVVHGEEAKNQVLTALSSTTLSGYIDTSANWRPGNNRGPIPGRVFDGADKQDGFNLNVVQLTLEKPLDEGQWSAGYKTDLVFGPNANYYGTVLNGGGGVAKGTPNPGGPDNNAANRGLNDFNIKQAYVALRVPVGNGIDIKMGVFDTVVGYEVFESGNNPNFSRSYGFALEPTHHTGVLASYHVTDWLSVAGGVANTSFGVINQKNLVDTQKAYLGALTLTLPESAGPLAGSAIYGGVVYGRGLGNPNGINTVNSYAGATLKTPLEGLAVGAAFDYRNDAPPGLTPTAASGLNPTGALLPTRNWAYATAGYVTYQAFEKLRLNARGDFTKGTDRTYYASTRPGEENELLGVTLTADYTLWQGLITRVEGRWDHALSGDRPFPRPPGTGADRNALTVALDMVYKF